MRQLSSAREAEKRWRYVLGELRVVEYSADSNDVSTEAEGSPVMRAVTKQRIAQTLQDGEYVACNVL
jgi:hypothetical protein